MVKAIVFDFDNTLGDRYRYAYLTYRQLIQEETELAPDSFQFEEIVQSLMLWDEFGSCNKRQLMEKLEKNYGIKIDPDYFIQWWNKTLASYTCVFPEAEEVIKYLKAKGYKLGVITDGDSKSQHQKLKNSGLEDYFDTIVYTNDYHTHKPDVQVYKVMEEALGLSSQECVFIGDMFNRDIKGSMDAGWQAIWMTTSDFQYCEYPVVRIKNLKELMRMY